MAKYISDKQYDFYKNIFGGKITRKTNFDTLWELIQIELLNDSAEIYVDLKNARIRFVLNDIFYECSRNRNEIIIMSNIGNVIEEKYDLLIFDVVDYIIDNKLIKTKKSRKKKEKN